MAEDIHRLVREHLRVEEPIASIGHDIGLMVAYAYAQVHRDDVSHLVIVDAPLPGSQVFDRLRSDPRVWHFFEVSSLTYHSPITIASCIWCPLSRCDVGAAQVRVPVHDLRALKGCRHAELPSRSLE